MLRTFSKIHGLAGLRVGYAVARPDVAAKLRRLTFTTPNTLGLAAATASLGDADFLAHELAAGLGVTPAPAALVVPSTGGHGAIIDGSSSASLGHPPDGYPMSAILHRSTRDIPPVAVSGDGPFIVDDQGRRYLDASGGAAVSCLGHSHRAVIDAIHAQVERLSYAHTSFFTTEAAEELADALVRGAPAGISHAYFVSGGSEAMEAALKLARQYFVEIGQPQRRHFIARRQSYHGNTLGALAVGGNAWRRATAAAMRRLKKASSTDSSGSKVQKRARICDFGL